MAAATGSRWDSAGSLCLRNANWSGDFLKQYGEVKPASGNPPDGNWVERNLRDEKTFLKTTLAELFLPNFPALVTVRQNDSLRAITDPIHEFEDQKIQAIFTEMILDQKKPAAYASKFAQGGSNIVRMVKNVNAHANVEAAVSVRKPFAIILLARNLASRPDQNFHSLDSHIRAHAHDQTGDGTATATDIKRRCTGRHELRKNLGEGAYASAQYKFFVKPSDGTDGSS
ncbi:MAG TPA: hypothetical protein VNX66_03890 [Candidatus Sulfotelmatobacter sp.]|nr:hypothetical protein [Candidatus Sulfotelmatobacter sp.]